MRTSAMVTAIVAVSTGFGVLVAQDQIAVRFAEWLAASVSERWIALAGINIAFFLLAAVMDELAIMVIFGPLLIAIADGFGVDPVPFVAIIVTNVAVGMSTPPIVTCLLVVLSRLGLRLGGVARK